MNAMLEGFQERWAAYFVRRMAEQVDAVLRAQDGESRARGLRSALDMAREAMLRIQSAPTCDSGEQEGLRQLERALEEIQAALNVFDIRDDQTVLQSRAHVAAAIRALDQACTPTAA